MNEDMFQFPIAVIEKKNWKLFLAIVSECDLLKWLHPQVELDNEKNMQIQ